MSALLLAPYNDSMRLGSGFNSFLQTPCLGNVVVISDTLITGKPTGRQHGTSQTVAYSASFVDKMSEVVRTMNISAGSSIRTGSVNTSSASSSIDEAKFTDSDLNAVLSVKVVNQTRVLNDKVTFTPPKVAKMSSEEFHNTYGDTFISGFIEGGDLHGIVSMKIIDVSRKSELKKQIKSQFNGPNPEWSPENLGQLSNLMSQTEVTITVNYAGGGMIKQASQEWTLQSLMATASAFPENVALCPQRTFAVLSRYNTIPSFVEWANKMSPAIQVRRYEGIQRYTSDLLDTFIEYKANLYILNDAIRHPELYQSSYAVKAVNLTLEAMVYERRNTKLIMEKMVQRIEALDKDPSSIAEIIKSEEIPEPELLRARLPVRKDPETEKAAADMLKNLWGIADSNSVADVKDSSDMHLKVDLAAAQEQNNALQSQLTDLGTQLTDTRAKADDFEKQLQAEKAAAKEKADAHDKELQAVKEAAKTDTDKANRWANYDAILAAKQQAEAKVEKWSDYDAIKAAKLQAEAKVERLSDYDTIKSGKEQAEASANQHEASANQNKMEADRYKALWESTPGVFIITIHARPSEDPNANLIVFAGDTVKPTAARIANNPSLVLSLEMSGGYDPYPNKVKRWWIDYIRRGEDFKRSATGLDGETVFFK